MANPNITIFGATYNGVSGVTLPTSNGTATFPWVEGSQEITQNGTYDVTALAQLVVNVSGGGGSGLPYETGTYKPSEDTARPTISFTNTHTKMPIFILMVDNDGYLSTSNTGMYWYYINWEQLFSPVYPSETSYRYGEERHSYRSTNATTITGTNTSITYPEANTTTSSNTYPRYWVTESGFRPYCSSSSRYWRANRNYKWIAIWKS